MLTATQKQLRRGKLGSSAAAAVLGLDPYRSAADVYLELTGQADDFAGNEATERGNILEPAIREWGAQQIGAKFVPDIMAEHPSGLLCWNADAVRCVADLTKESVTEAMECKSTVDANGWGEAGTDEIPERHLVQIAHAFAVVPTLKIMWVPVLLPGFKRFDFRLYRVDRNDELASIVERSGLDFMENYVVPKVQPTDFRPSLEVLRRVRREPNKIVPVAAELLDRYIVLNAAKKQAEEDAETAQAALITALGDAEAGVTSTGQRCTYFQQTQRRVDTKAFRAARPDLAEEFDTEINFRVLRFPKK